MKGVWLGPAIGIPLIVLAISYYADNNTEALLASILFVVWVIAAELVDIAQCLRKRAGEPD